MAKYRPISPNAAWRCPSHDGSEIISRYLELYFLTSTYTNTIGCYHINFPIVCAETGIKTIGKLLYQMEILKDRGVIDFEGNFVLVKTWFRHNIWESTFQGKVAVTAEKEAHSLPGSLKEKWVRACIEAGVSQKVLASFVMKPGSSSSDGAGKELPYNNENTEQNENTTSNKNALIPPENNQVRGSGDSQILLTAKGEAYRVFLEKTLEELPKIDAQALADEVCGALEAVENGARKPIVGMHAWLQTLISKFHAGAFCPQSGIVIAERRKDAARKDAKAIEVARENEQAIAKATSCTIAIQTFIDQLSDDELAKFAEFVGKQAQHPAARKAAVTAVLSRTIPSGLGKAEIVQAVESWNAGDAANKRSEP